MQGFVAMTAHALQSVELISLLPTSFKLLSLLHSLYTINHLLQIQKLTAQVSILLLVFDAGLCVRFSATPSCDCQHQLV